MFRDFQNPVELKPLDHRVDDFEEVVESVIWGVIALAFVLVIIPAVTSIILR